jgi:pyruvate/2-oxoglutarate dehydrogenase complex dihydrolipoamide acyltransferase (E2) component
MKLISTIYTPQESVNDDFLSLITVNYKTGDFVKKDALIAEFETSKAVVEVRADTEGFIVVHATAGSDVRVGSKLFELYDSPGGETTSESGTPAPEAAGQPAGEEHTGTNFFSKAALAWLEKNPVDKRQYETLAFVTTKDLIPKRGSNSQMPKTAPGNRGSSNGEPGPGKVRQTDLSDKTIKPISRNKKREFEYLYSVNSSSVISRLSIVVHAAGLDAIGSAQQFIKSTPLPSIIQEVSKLLLKYPNLNSFYLDGDQVFYNRVHVGFALDDGKNGLKVAAVADTEQLSLQQIEEQINELSLRYVNNQLSIQDLTLATFTITDLFNSNITGFHPLVNNNNSCILGISSLRNGEFVIELSFDHRLTSGKEVSQFLDDLKFRLEVRFKGGSSTAGNAREDIHCNVCYRSLDDDLNGKVYFQKVLNSKFDGYICSVCLNGW